MASNTPKLGLLKKDPVEDAFDTFNIKTMLNDNWDKVDSHARDYVSHSNYVVASGTNTYTATIEGLSLAEGVSIKVKFTSANTGASTLNINGTGAQTIKKSNGNDLTSGNIKAGQICHLVYTGANFQLLGEGGEYGTATASDVLTGKTFGTEDGLANGIMPNNGAVTQSLPINGSYTIPAGYHDGNGKVTQSVTTKTAQTYTPGTTNQAISANQYLTGAQTILGDADLIAANIVSGKNIFGVNGAATIESLGGKKFATGENTTGATPLNYADVLGNTDKSAYPLTVSGLSFTPTFIFAVCFYDDTTTAFYIPGKFNDCVVFNEPGGYSERAQPTGNYYINNGGFKIPVARNDRYVWYAIG